MVDSWGICQPSAWAFQTMAHNVLDSPEKQPGAWKLPAHHLNSLIWALSGSPIAPTLFVHLSPSLSISNFLFSFTLQAFIFCFTLYLKFCAPVVFPFFMFLIFTCKCYAFPSSDKTAHYTAVFAFSLLFFSAVTYWKQHQQMPLIRSWAAGHPVVKYKIYTAADTHSG